MTQHTPPADDARDSRSDDLERRTRRRDDTEVRRRSMDRLFALSAPIRFTSTPFAWQHGADLYLLVNDWTGWVLAELKFVPSGCHYVEIRRTSYRWPREAAGVLLSRTLVLGEATSRQLARDVTTWLETTRDHRSSLPLDR
ncbi:MAG: hypothetical protein H0V24_04245 [Chloroflexia bacterium]|nr:hypothetical protein [Chloroflexia bacterium]MDQ3412703.1 hypothetical protein [Chloroflexota bacterium]